MHFFRIFLHPFDISFKMLRESTLYFGYNPCLCFNAAHSVNVLERKKEEVMLQVQDVAGKEGNIPRLLSSSLDGGQSVSHTIFVISPTNKKRFIWEYEFGAVSPWSLGLLLKEYETQRADATAAFYRYISRDSYAALLWGQVFERQVLNYLDGIDAEHKFSIRGLAFSDSEQMTWTYRRPLRRFTFLQDLDFLDEITKAFQNKKPVHLVPSASNFPTAIDSILYDPNEVLTFIRITVRREHQILVSGLRRIQTWLEREAPLAGLSPSEEKPWRFIFIVPSDEAPSFELQRLEGDTAQGEWAGKVQQYVLGLDVLGKKPMFKFRLG